jgi:hypothetical protein
MNHFTRHLTVAAAIGIAAASTIARADEDERRGGRNAYVVTSLVSNLPGHARVQDAVLQNAWGVAFSPAGSPFWVNDNGTGCSTLYTGDGTQVPLQVSIPLPGNIVPSGSVTRPTQQTGESRSRHADRDRMESLGGVFGSGYQTARRFHLRHRGWDAFRLGRRAEPGG